MKTIIELEAERLEWSLKNFPEATPRSSMLKLQSEAKEVLKEFSCYRVGVGSLTLAHNVLQLQEVGDFEAQNCLPPLNLIRSTKLHLTTEPPIS
jgi:hypothetical protein